MESLFTVDAFLALLTLTAMEIVLGIDNIIFISILVGKLPAGEQREEVRRQGIALALVSRMILLFSMSWVMSLKAPLFSILEHSLSGRDLILIFGGLFLLGKATFEIHDKVESGIEQAKVNSVQVASSGALLVQIAILDIVFSLDSVITAVGMADQLIVMIIAMVVAVGVMLVSSTAIGEFVERHPTVKILALSFLLLVGVMLVMEGMGGHVDKGYIYFAMFFSLGVELLNIRYQKKQQVLQRQQEIKVS